MEINNILKLFSWSRCYSPWRIIITTIIFICVRYSIVITSYLIQCINTEPNQSFGMFSLTSSLNSFCGCLIIILLCLWYLLWLCYRKQISHFQCSEQRMILALIKNLLSVACKVQKNLSQVSDMLMCNFELWWQANMYKKIRSSWGETGEKNAIFREIN